MVKSELKKELEIIVEKIKKQNELFNKKIKELNPLDAAKNPKLYEKFMPVIDQFQDDLTYVSSEIYNVIESLNENLSNMFDSVEKELEKLDNSEIDEEDYNTEENEEENEELDLEGPTVETSFNFNNEE